MATFTFAPSHPVRKRTRPRVKVTAFGDGYEQRQAEGMNPIALQYDLTFGMRTPTEADAIEAFLEARGGVENFDWTPPGGVQAKYVCREWDRDRQTNGAELITATFIQVFEP